MNCNRYNNNYPNQRKNKEKPKEICPFKKVRRLLVDDGGKCIEVYGKVCCNTVKEMTTDPKLPNQAPVIVGNEQITPSEGLVKTQVLVEVTTTTPSSSSSSSSTTTTTSDSPIVGNENEVISIEGPTTETTPQTTAQTTTETTSEANRTSLIVIKEQLKEQITGLLAKIDQTNLILTQKEMEAQRKPVSLPSVSASDILKITNSKLSPKDAIKALRILAYKKISENLKNGEEK